MKLTAITRDLNPDMGNCELTYLERITIDTSLALRQHEAYAATLKSIGCEMVSIPTAEGLADSVFIEDTIIVLDEIAVLCRPGAESRRAEVAGVERVLQRYRRLAAIQAPGTLDGGDLLCVGKVIYAGLSTRSNQSGIDQLHGIVADYGYTVKAVATNQCLHLKSAISKVTPDTLLINPNWIAQAEFSDCDFIEIDKQEAHAANALLVGAAVIYPTSCPRTLEKLQKHGIDVRPVDVSELEKAEGAVTCCSLILNTL